MERQALRDVQENNQPHPSHSGRDETHPNPEKPMIALSIGKFCTQ